MYVLATAGHVDHGKSSLVLALTGTDPDRFPEEKARGLTIDLGFAFTTLDAEVVGFVDVPGHIRFIKNMLAGVGAVEVAVLVVAANEGWMPQTDEHARILELLGVEHGLIVLSKADLVDDETLELDMRRNATYQDGEAYDASSFKLAFDKVQEWTNPHPPGAFLNFAPDTTLTVVDPKKVSMSAGLMFLRSVGRPARPDSGQRARRSSRAPPARSLSSVTIPQPLRAARLAADARGRAGGRNCAGGRDCDRGSDRTFPRR